jgi:hypothetical protein
MNKSVLKNIILTTIMLGSFAFIACEKDEKPEVVLPETTTTTVAQETTTTIKPVPPHCLKEGKKFYCGNPVWWKMEACKPDSDGDGQGEGEVYFTSEKEISEQWASANVGSCVNFKMKDGSEHKLPVVGFGPCITCQEL